uniref:Nuclear envelope phosphatase-regulatory subunit 1 n=1 Tax=Cyprinus carpio TaxID=7962 RepID=A0A8C1TBV6_CYPCA
MNSLEQAEDLKAFERRLTEYVSCLQPATGRWRMILIVVSVCTATGAWNWLIDPDTQKVCQMKRCQISVKCRILLICPYSCLSVMSSLSTGFFLLVFMESSIFHHQLCDSDWPFLCWNTQTSCRTIYVSFIIQELCTVFVVFS